MDSFKCSHCQQNFDLTAAIEDENANKFCCNGCKNVYAFLRSNGLGEFYSRLGNSAIEPVKSTQISEEISQNFYKNYVKKDGDFSEIFLIIDGIHCAACIWLNEKVLFSSEGIIEAEINSATNKARIKWDDEVIKLSEILQKISAIGYNPHPYDPTKAENIANVKRREFYSKMLVGIFCTMNIMWVAIALYGGYFSGMEQSIKDILHFAEFILASPVLFYTGSEFFKSAKISIKNKTPNMDLSIIAGASITYLYSIYAMFSRQGEVYFDSVAMIITFVFIGKFLEVLSKKRAIDNLDSLSSMLVSEVSVKNGDKFELKNANDVKAGDIILLNSGSKVLIDGKIIHGEASFDYSSLNGESIPVHKANDDEILSGAICLDGSVWYEASKNFENSTLCKIINLLERASFKKPDIQKMANNLAGIFSIIILLLGFATFLFWLIFMAQTSKALIVAVSVIIIACPCALALATPVATLIGLGMGLKKGVIFKEAKFLESLAKCKFVVFDKTGTLSKAQLQVTKITKFKEFDINLLLSLTSLSTHPVSKAISKDLKGEIYTLSDVKNIVSKGVSAKFGNLTLHGGSAKFINELGFGNFTSDKTNYIFAINGEVVAQIELCDTIREDAKSCIESLKKSGVQIFMLTGDNQSSAKSVASELGIDNVYFEMSPLQKGEFIENLAKNGGVAMVGDGLNDSLALSYANVGISLGSGADVSVEKSDIVLMKDNLASFEYAFSLSRTTYKTIKQNLALCLTYNAVTIPLAMCGFIIPLIAAISMSFSSVLVILNSMKIRLKKD